MGFVLKWLIKFWDDFGGCWILMIRFWRRSDLSEFWNCVPCVRVGVVESRCGEDERNGFRHWKLCILGPSDFWSLEPDLEVGQRGLEGGVVGYKRFSI